MAASGPRTRAELVTSAGGEAAQRPAELEQLAGAICGARSELELDEQRIALGIYRLLAEGEPLAPTATADRLGVAAAGVEHALSGWPATVRDEHGRVVGYGGLGLGETAHRFEVDGRRLYGWCAWDTLFLPELLGASAHVSSTCPASGAAIALHVSPAGVDSAAPQSTVVSMVVPAEPFGDDVIERFCSHVRFFSSAQAAAPLLAEEGGAFTLALSEAFELGRLANHIVFPYALDRAEVPC
jgi:alkylmercury lyase